MTIETTQETYKHDFDLTHFSDASTFKQILDEHGLTEYVRIHKYDVDYNNHTKTYWAFVWYNPETGLTLQTGNNPISGKYTNGNQRADEKGYASTMAVEGPKNAANSLVDDLIAAAAHIKSHGHEAGYTAVHENIRQTVTKKCQQ